MAGKPAELTAEERKIIEEGQAADTEEAAQDILRRAKERSRERAH